ncbi:DEAD/DEAH box helicase [Aquirufa regiilacus]|uniref:RNA helicase n=1 Tax=Aquirufa regiilacus TaxID=3024868 RepID=A0ABU3TR37_9BACT|nr:MULTISPECIES: DEAD/DEAH box helicase [unclassified Aquirufa]MBP6054274.1 DEAD/DEAH box helicase [Cytophagaceae bacterium]MBP6093933.1 DEAD/DEAH box helicase [Cytophagaceae bacterium]MDT8886701.1 DEAD/DEAH box helicase [Aquirufa sp. LEPPI-3A]MDU0808334.1 DEAD/DEAH box helicase [Aquirufa sp. LEOWEIH-7C]
MSEKIRFDSLPLSEGIQEAVKEMGFEFASPIQSEAIPYVLEGRDVIGQAQTGTGKTAAFGIPMIEHIVPFEKFVQAIILCPTRELAVQVSEEMKKLSKFTKGVWVTTVYGGDSIDRQIKSLKAGANIVVGTPGRVIDLIERRALKLQQASMIVLDEADEMLDMGFREDIESILQEMPNERQTVLFSATMSKPIMALTSRYLTEPKLVKVVKNEITNVNIEQLYFDVKGRAKMEVTTRLIDFYALKLMLIFCNQKKRVDEVVEELVSRGYAAEGLHGDLRQSQRTQVMNRFRNGNVNILVATDVAARGLDVDNVDAVINYDIPLDEEYYVHRIGRTGRAGKFGKAFTLVVGSERNRLREIMNYTKVKIDKGVIPSFTDVVGIKKGMFIERVAATINEGDLEVFSDSLENLQHAGFSTEQIVAALVKMNMGIQKNEFGDENLEGELERQSRKYGREERGGGYRDRDSRGGGERRGGGRFDRDSRGGGDRGGRFERGGDRDRDRGPRGPRVDREGKPYKTDENMVRMFVNIGFNEKISPSNIVGAFAGETGIPGNVLGQIQIENKHTYVDVPKEYANQVIDKMVGAQIKGKRVLVEIAKPV